MYVTQKSISDPLGYQVKRIARPIAFSIILAVIHVTGLRIYFEMDYRNPAACYMTNDYGPYIDEIAKGVLFIVAVSAAIVKLDFSRKINMEGRLNAILKPYIRKLDIMALFQAL